MKTIIKITVNGNTYEVESSYEHSTERIMCVIEKIIEQELLIQDKK